MKRAKKKPRKPGQLIFHHGMVAEMWRDDEFFEFVDITCPNLLNAKGCRRLAAWLMKAADYLQSKEKP